MLGFVKSTPVARPKKDAENPREVSREYRIGEHRVCKDFLLGTFNIDKMRLTRVCKEFEKTKAPATDKRGKGSAPNKIREELVQNVVDHINTFPLYESHYCREKSKKKYLNPELNIPKMYEMYIEYCQENQFEPVKKWKYRQVFYTQFNISFHTPQTDTCNKCTKLSVLVQHETDPQKKREVAAALELHQRKAEAARKAKKSDAKRRIEDHILVASFDLQKTLPLPFLRVNRQYYSRQVNLLNLGIHLINTGKCHMNIWMETEGSRGTREIGSAILNFVVNKIPDHVKAFIAYCDSCPGQNKNSLMPKYVIVAMQKNQNLDYMAVKYLVPGHTYMESDQDFGLIEKRKKVTNAIYDKDGWKKLMKESSSKRFEVEELGQDKMFDCDSIPDLKVPKKDVDGIPIRWLEIQWIQVDRENPPTLLFKESLLEGVPFRKVWRHEV